MIMTPRAAFSAVAFVSIFSFTAFSMDNLERSFRDLANANARLERNLSNLMSFAPSTVCRAPSAFPSHSQFLSLPEELKGKKLAHIKCDCQRHEHIGHYCMTLALAHALDDAQLYGAINSEACPLALAKAAFEKLSFNSTDERTRSMNLERVATSLRLDASYLTVAGGLVVSNLADSGESNIVRALRELSAFRNAIMKAGQNPVVKHVFFFYKGETDGHVAVFNLIWDGREFYIKLHDNLNKPIVRNTPLFTMATMLVDYFHDAEFEAIEQLVTILEAPEKRDARIAKFREYRARDQGGQNQTNSLLAYLADNWLSQKIPAVTEAGLCDISSLNEPIKHLKKIAVVNKESNAKWLVLSAYNAMLDVIEKTSGRVEMKREKISKVIDALKRSAKEQKLFSLVDDKDARDIFERAEALRSSLTRC